MFTVILKWLYLRLRTTYDLDFLFVVNEKNLCFYWVRERKSLQTLTRNQCTASLNLTSVPSPLGSLYEKNRNASPICCAPAPYAPPLSRICGKRNFAPINAANTRNGAASSWPDGTVGNVRDTKLIGKPKSHVDRYTCGWSSYEAHSIEVGFRACRLYPSNWRILSLRPKVTKN